MNRKEEIINLKKEVGKLKEENSTLSKQIRSIINLLLRANVIDYVDNDKKLPCGVSIPYVPTYDIHGIVSINNKRYDKFNTLLDELGYEFAEVKEEVPIYQTETKTVLRKVKAK